MCRKNQEKNVNYLAVFKNVSNSRKISIYCKKHVSNDFIIKMLFRKILIIFTFIVISTFLFRQFGVNTYEGFRGEAEGMFYDSATPNPENPEDCAGHMCGWNNSVSGDCRYKFAPETLKNKQRAFKYPHYYGYGTGSGFHYGEPYYTRTIDY